MRYEVTQGCSVTRHGRVVGTSGDILELDPKRDEAWIADQGHKLKVKRGRPKKSGEYLDRQMKPATGDQEKAAE